MSGIASAHGGKDGVDWSEVRTTYETTRTTLREIADRFGISFSTTMKRAAREKWRKPGSVIVEARKKIDGAINRIVEETAESNASKSCGTSTSRKIRSLNHSRRRLWIDTTTSFGAISA